MSLFLCLSASVSILLCLSLSLSVCLSVSLSLPIRIQFKRSNIILLQNKRIFFSSKISLFIANWQMFIYQFNIFPLKKQIAFRSLLSTQFEYYENSKDLVIVDLLGS